MSTALVDQEVTCEMTCEDDFDLQDLSDMPDLPLETENVLAYMSGYILRKCGFNDVCSRHVVICTQVSTCYLLLSFLSYNKRLLKTLVV